MMTPNQIRAAFLLAEPPIKIGEIAEACKASKVQVHQVIKGDRPTIRIRREIARRLGKRVEDIFPPSKRQARRLEKSQRAGRP